jgi:predicted CXXCH cytochrome family protein
MRMGHLAGAVVAVWALLSVWLGMPGAVGAQGFDPVLTSRHNILAAGPSAPKEMVCVSCHVEGNPTNTVPAWDRENPIRSFSLRHVTQPPPGKGTPETRPFGPSFDCLECHDGVLGNNVHQLGFSGSAPTGNPESIAAIESGLRLTDHPDSIEYPREPGGRLLSDRTDPKLKRYWSIPDRNDDGIVLPTGPRSTALSLQNIDPNDPAAVSELVRTYLGVVHCDTCHNPHIDAIRPFLRAPHKTLCLVCHDR